MAIYTIADLRWKIDVQYPYTTEKLKDYLDDGDAFDEEMTITKEELLYERTLAPDATPANCEFTAILRRICHRLLCRYDGLFLHAATIVYKNKAYAFTAPPGTGKSTHCLLWKRVLGENNVHFLNGDKLLLRFQDSHFVAYGSPWQGKENYGENASYELGGIFILNRAVKNSASPASPTEALRETLKATVVPDDANGKIKLLDRLEQLLKIIRIFTIHVNTEDDAVYTALSCIES